MNQDDNGITKLGCVNHDCDKCKAQQQQEPVAFIRSDHHGDVALEWDKDEDLEGGLYFYEPLYTSPPASKPLTDEQIAEIAAQGHQRWIEFARAIEAALGIKE